MYSYLLPRTLTMEDAMSNQTLPGREIFFSTIRTKITEERLITAIEVAYRIAKYAHKDQLRDDGERYFDHVKTVAWIILTEVDITDQFYLTILLCVALLHDLMEDTFLAEQKHLHFMFDQISPDITNSAWELTNPRGATKVEKWKKLLASVSIITLIVKAADRLHNSRTIGACTIEKQDRKKAETRDVIIPWLRRVVTQPADFLTIPLQSLTDKIAALV